MTGMEHAIERVARMLYQLRHPNGDPIGGPHPADDRWAATTWAEIEMRDARATARALADAGLIAPATLHEQWAKSLFGESHRRWATEWEPVARAEDDGKGDQ